MRRFVSNNCSFKNTRGKLLVSIAQQRDKIGETDVKGLPVSKTVSEEEIVNEDADTPIIPKRGIPESPLPDSAEEIYEQLADIVQDVFGDSQNEKDNESSSEARNCLRTRPEVFMKAVKAAQASSEGSQTQGIPESTSKSSEYFTKSLQCAVKPSKEKNRDQRRNSMSFLENLEESSITSIESLLQVNHDVTPVPSPKNAHTTCRDVFCAIHDNNCDVDKQPSTTAHLLYPLSRKSSSRASRSEKRENTRKRRRCVSQWSDVKRKYLKNLGKEHYNKKGNFVNEKAPGPACSCQLKCFDFFTKAERQEICENFWKLGDRQKQWAYVIKYSTKENKKRALHGDIRQRRKFTFKYFLPRKQNLNFTNVNVCKVFFLSTLSVSEKTVFTAWKKYDGVATVQRDERGRHDQHQIKIIEDVKASVWDHVKSFSPVESHYNRKNSNKLYLDGSLSFARMYHLYKEWFDGEKYTKGASSLRQYRDIVNENFNISFHIPKKDKCDVCHIFESKEVCTEEEKLAHQEHLTLKTILREAKRKDKIEAASSKGQIISACFDFQKILNCPHGNASIFYYKRKLSVFNFTLYDMGTKRGICYVWDETIAKRGSNEVSSCLLDFIKHESSKGCKEFRFWSDNCAGQNRNRIVYSFYMYAAKKFNITIIHSFLEKGHTQNEGDSVHAVIENVSKPRTIYNPDEWKTLIRWAKVEGNSYEVREIGQNDMYDFKKLLEKNNWTKCSKKKRIFWNKIKQVKVSEDAPNILQFKYHINDSFQSMIVRSATRQYSSVEIELLRNYDDIIPITSEKYKDLISLCNNGIIPERYHSYYMSLPYNSHTTSAENEESHSE